MDYITYKQYNQQAIGGKVNIKIGEKLTCTNGMLYYKSKAICRNTSENAHEYFMRNDDGHGLERGALIEEIKTGLASNPENWEKIEEDAVCIAFLRDLDVRLWNHAFYNTTIENLEYIKNIAEG